VLYSLKILLFLTIPKNMKAKILRKCWRLVNTLAQKGSKFKVILICVLHQLNKGITSNTLLPKMDALIIFPHYFDMNTFNSIVNHIGKPKEVVEALYKLDDLFLFEIVPLNIFS
jgi:hypothetical protein